MSKGLSDAEFLVSIEHQCRKSAPAHSMFMRDDIIRLLMLAGDPDNAATWMKISDRWYALDTAVVLRSVEQARLVTILGGAASVVDKLQAEIDALRKKYEPDPPPAPNLWGKRFVGGIGAAYEQRHG